MKLASNCLPQQKQHIAQNYAFNLSTIAITLLALLGLLIWPINQAYAATFAVNCGDVAALRTAIEDANDNGQADIITLNADNQANCSYVFADSVEVFGDGGALSLERVKSEITIEGNNTTLQINSTNHIRFFALRADGKLTLKNMTLRNGHSENGGAIWNDGVLTLDNVTLRDNMAENEGGAIYVFNGGETHISNSDIIFNYANAEGGGIFALVHSRTYITASNISDNTVNLNFFADNNTADGGGIFAHHRTFLRLTDSIVARNIAENGGGIFLDETPNAGLVNATKAEIINSIIESNVITSENALGGGIFAHQRTTLTMQNSTVRNNVANDSTSVKDSQGGGIYVRGNANISGSIIENNHSTFRGGGIFALTVDPINSSNALNIINTQILSNTTGRDGGGIYNSQGNLQISDSFIAHNFVEGIDFVDSYGGGIYHKVTDMTIENTIIYDNRLESRNNRKSGGAGIYTSNGIVTIENSTISGNQATETPGGSARGQGAGIFGNSGNIDLRNSTVAFNIASGSNSPRGAGLYSQGTIVFAVANSLIAQNNATAIGNDIYGTYFSNGHNLIGEMESHGSITGFTAGINGDLVGATGSTIDPMLGPLADNGGNTLTHALLPSSPALNMANPATPGSGGNACLNTDQRALPRPPFASNRCDIGAFELQSASPEPEIEVEGNSTLILANDTTPSTTDNTDFGNADVDSSLVSHSFTIKNTGQANLNLIGSPLVNITGPNATDFSVTVQPVTPITPTGTITFEVTFDPSTLGLHMATVSIINNDPDETPYTFAIQGTGVTSGGAITIIKSADPADDTVFNFSSDIPGGTTFTLQAPADNSEPFIGLDAGSYTITELVTSGWLLTNIDCGIASHSINGNSVTLTLADGDNLVCTFSNSLDTDGDTIPNSSDPDDDNDGQTDTDEVTCGSDPLNNASTSPDNDSDNSPDCVDSDDDNDGLPDIDEATYGANPLMADTDADNLNDGQEVALGTLPNNADTDGDTIPDDVEVGDINNPTDTDEDGKIDALESNIADADGDTLVDQIDPNDNDGPNGDLDGDTISNSTDPDDDNDGQTDVDEVACGSDPLNAASTAPDSDGDNIPDCVDPEDNSANLVYVSSSTSGNVDGVSFTDDDILAYNPDEDRWALVFDGSDIGLTSNDLESFYLLDEGNTLPSILMSFTSDQDIAGLGAVSQNDIIKFVPTSLGDSTAGSFTTFLDGSTVGLSGGSERIDAIGFDPTGRLVISTIGSGRVPGTAGPDVISRDEDLIVLNHNDTWELYFDGSNESLTGSNEDIWAIWIDTNGDIYLSTQNTFSIPGLSGDGDDIFICTPISLGENNTSCTFSPYWIGEDYRFNGELIDGLSIGVGQGSNSGGTIEVITQDVTVQLDSAGNATILATEVDNGSTASLGIASLAVVPNSFTCADVGTNSVTLTVENINGATATGSAIVTVEDSLDPVALSQNVTANLNGSGSVTVSASQVDAGSTDACGIAAVALDQDTFTATGNYPVVLSVTDVNGNSATAAATVTVIDQVAVQALAQDVTLLLDATGQAVLSANQVDNGSSAIAGIASLTVSPDNFTCADIGSNTVTLTVEDINGLTDSATAIVTVEDVSSPTALAQNVAVNLNGSGSVTVSASQVDAGSTDACGIVSLSLDQDTFIATGDYPVVLTVTDSSGNVATANTTVTVIDVAPPVAVTQDITVQLDATGNATITPIDVDGGSTLSTGTFVFPGPLSVSPDSFTCTDVDANTVTLTVTDFYGQSDSATAIVTVEDSVAPVALAQSIAIELDSSGNATITGTQIDAGSSDACGIASLSLDITSFTTADLGDNTVTLIVTDDNGNASTATATVTVSEAPSASGQLIYISASEDGSVSGISYSKDDILVYNVDADTWAIFFDASDVGLTDLNAFELIDDGNTLPSLLLSVSSNQTLPDVGAVDNHDIVKFTPTSVGDNTAGSFSSFFVGIPLGLDSSGETISAITIAPDGRLLVSTDGNFSTVTAFGRDEDLFALNPDNTWSFYFDGSDGPLANSPEELWGAWVHPVDGRLFLSTRGTFVVPGLSGNGADIFVCEPTSLGSSTSCTFAPFWSAASHGFTTNSIDGLSLQNIPTTNTRPVQPVQDRLFLPYAAR